MTTTGTRLSAKPKKRLIAGGSKPPTQHVPNPRAVAIKTRCAIAMKVLAVADETNCSRGGAGKDCKYA